MGPWVLLLWIALTGIVKSPEGSPVSNATVSIRNVVTGATKQVTTDASGRYTAPDLAPGDYEVTAAAQGFGPATAKIAVSTAAQTLDLALVPPSKSTDLSLGDLGFTPDQTKGSAAAQARLDRRTHMLKIHQRLGLITTAPLIATLIAANGAKGGHNAESSSSSGRQLHAALGGITAGLYLTTASFAIFAPKAPPGTQLRGPIRVHRMLAWIHGPGMILTPILGAIAYQQRERGEKVHGIAQAHAPAAVITSIAYGLAIVSVSIKF